MKSPSVQGASEQPVEYSDLLRVRDAIEALTQEVEQTKAIALLNDCSPEGLLHRAQAAEQQLVLSDLSQQKLIRLLGEGEESLRVSRASLSILSKCYVEEQVRLHASDIVLQSLNKLDVNSEESLKVSQAALKALLQHHEEAEEKLKASDAALDALTKLNANSEDNLKVSQAGLRALTQHLAGTEENLRAKDTTLDALTKLIELNKETFQASFLALQVVSRLASYDTLTDLPNRRLLNDKLSLICEVIRQRDCHGALLFLDLDKFKCLNDRYGHALGDQLLIAVADRLKLQVSESDTVARFGGDEFVVILTGLDAERASARVQMHALAEKIRQALCIPYTLTIRHHGIEDELIQYHCTVSIGVALIDRGDGSPANLIDWADEAMYQAKRDGGNTVRFYDPIQSSQVTVAYLYSLATAYDIETANHGIRLQQYVQALALRLQKMDRFPGQLNEDAISFMIKATPLHDIGKTKIPIAIVQKPGSFNDREWAIMQTHTVLGETILSAARKQNANLDKLLDMATTIAGGHHERWDGQGYPSGLAGEKIPLAARLVAIADVYDALVTLRIYKPQWTHEQAVQAIRDGRGTQFDPEIVDAFLLEQDNFRTIALRYSDHPGGIAPMSFTFPDTLRAPARY